ncbi:hypothetical protein ACQBAU_16360 [Propionibacteriaceae bacterium Y2011]
MASDDTPHAMQLVAVAHAGAVTVRLIVRLVTIPPAPSFPTVNVLASARDDRASGGIVSFPNVRFPPSVVSPENVASPVTLSVPPIVAAPVTSSVPPKSASPDQSSAPPPSPVIVPPSRIVMPDWL